MKAIIGIDEAGNYQAALHLLSRLAFANATAELFHAVDPLALTVEGVVGQAYAASVGVAEDWQKWADDLLSQAQKQCFDLGIPSTTLRQVGKPTSHLMERSSEIYADLIAVGSTHKPAYGALVLGSVGRGLTIGAHQSLLIAKKEVKPVGPLTAVFATDGSEYSDSCLRMLARMAPRGIGRLVLVNAGDYSQGQEAHDHARHHIDSLVGHLCEAGFNAEGHVVDGAPAEVIEAMMKSTNADLLIMGAQGHGFFNRILVGSLSLQMVTATPHSILLLRLP